MERYHFEKTTEICVGLNVYTVEVEGYNYPDYDCTYNEFTSIIVTDEDGNLVDKDHEDYLEVIEQTQDLDIDRDYETEGLDCYE